MSSRVSSVVGTSVSLLRVLSVDGVCPVSSSAATLRKFRRAVSSNNYGNSLSISYLGANGTTKVSMEEFAVKQLLFRRSWKSLDRATEI